MRHGIAAPGPVQYQGSVAVDDCEQVVEVVGHAAGQASEALHLLSLPQLRFQVLAGRHVAGHTVQAERLPPLVQDDAGIGLQPDGLPVTGAAAKLDGCRLFAAQVGCGPGFQAFAIFRFRQIQGVPADQFLPAHRPDAQRRGVGIGNAEIQVQRVDEVVGMFEQVAILALAGGQGAQGDGEFLHFPACQHRGVPQFPDYQVQRYVGKGHQGQKDRGRVGGGKRYGRRNGHPGLGSQRQRRHQAGGAQRAPGRGAASEQPAGVHRYDQQSQHQGTRNPAGVSDDRNELPPGHCHEDSACRLKPVPVQEVQRRKTGEQGHHRERIRYPQRSAHPRIDGDQEKGVDDQVGLDQPA